MKTAVEILIDEHFGGIENCTPAFRIKITKALNIHRQQLIDFYIANMKLDLISEGDVKWKEEYLPKIKEFANKCYNEIYSKEHEKF